MSASAHRRLHSPEFLQLHVKGNGNVSDYSGHGNHGTWAGGTAAYTPGPFNGRSVMNFSGALPYVGVTVPLVPVGASPRTIACMVKFDNDATVDGLFGYGTTAALQECSIRREASGLISLQRNGGSVTLSTTALISGPRWHVVMTYDGTTVNGYVNGTFELSGAVVLNTVGTSCMIAKRYADASADTLDGTLSDVRVYNFCATGDEVAALYEYDTR